MARVDEITRIAERRMGRRGLLRTFALGGAGIAAAAVLGCSDDDGDAEMEGDEMTPTGEAMTPTGEAMNDETMTVTPGMTGEAMTPTGTAISDGMSDDMDGEMMAEDYDLGEARQFGLIQGWHRGEGVTYYDFGMNSATNGPAVTAAPIFALIHGMDAGGNPRFVEGQHNIVDVVPGDAGYSDLWAVNFVVVPEEYEANSITSVADLQAMDYEVMTPGLTVNCPIVPAGSTLEGGEELVQGWYRGQAVYYPDFGMNPAVAIPIWVFAAGMDASGNPQLVEGQHNIIDAVPGEGGYSDFWHVRVVMVDGMYEANSITSAQGVADSGFEVVQTSMVVNCPVVPRG